jgi:hypothetical protein
MTNEVADLIGALRDGKMSLEDVAHRFRERTWPPSKKAPPASYLEMATRATQDPEPDVPDSFDEVAAAYHRGELTRPQFRALAEAAAESKRTSRHQGGT